MKEYSLHLHPISNKWRAIPQERPLSNLAVLILSGIAVLAFVFGFIALGILMLPPLAYLIWHGLWKRMGLMFLVWTAIAIIALAGNAGGFFLFGLFENNPDAWWNNLAIKIILGLILFDIYLQILAYPVGYGAALLDWEGISATKAEKLEKAGFIHKGYLSAASKKAAISRAVTEGWGPPS